MTVSQMWDYQIQLHLLKDLKTNLLISSLTFVNLLVNLKVLEFTWKKTYFWPRWHFFIIYKSCRIYFEDCSSSLVPNLCFIFIFHIIYKNYWGSGIYNMVCRGVWGSPLQFRSHQYFRALGYPSCTPSPMLRQTRGTFGFDKPYKQTQRKMRLTGRISSNR